MKKIVLGNFELIINFRPLHCAMDESLWNRLLGDEKLSYENLQNRERQIEWCEARRCLYEIFDVYGLSDDKIYNLSHSWWNNSGMAAAVVVNKSLASKTEQPISLGIGIDTENKERKISNTLVQAMSSGFESLMPIDSISIWSIKEACFKANPYKNKSEDFKCYQIKIFDPEIQTGIVQEVASCLQYTFILFGYMDWQIAVATTCGKPTTNA